MSRPLPLPSPTVVVLEPVPALSTEVLELLKANYPSFVLRRTQSAAEASRLLSKSEFGLLFCEVSDVRPIRGLLKMAFPIAAHAGELAQGIIVFSAEQTRLQFQPLERSGHVQQLKSGTPPKALKLKVELFLSKLWSRWQNSLKQLPAEAPNLTLVPRLPAPAPEPAPSPRLFNELYPNPILVLLSPRGVDLSFAAELANANHSSFHHFPRADVHFSDFLARYPQAIVLWDIDHPDVSRRDSFNHLESTGLLLSRYLQPSQVLTVSDQSPCLLPESLHLQQRLFMHGLQRRTSPGSVELYSRLLLALRKSELNGIEQFFPKGQHREEITLRKSAHRGPAVESTETFLTNNGLKPRLARTVSQAVDELLLNALFDAPVDEKLEHYRMKLDRSSLFDLNKRERVRLELMSNEQYFGLSVRDCFGSFEPERLGARLYAETRVPNSRSQGIGLRKAVGSGLSLLIVISPGKWTDISLFFPRTSTHREFKQSFCFLSTVVIEPKPT